MQLEVSQKSHISQTQELESVKEVLSKIEEMNQQRKMMEEEQHRKESSLVSQVTNYLHLLFFIEKVELITFVDWPDV